MRLTALTVVGGALTIGTNALKPRELHAESQDDRIKKRGGSLKEEIRDSLSSQHMQVKQSWENPGVYAWGSNSGRVVQPDSDEKFVKEPVRISFFDGWILRDLKMDTRFGAAVSQNGDLYQWGLDYSSDTPQPEATLMGKNIVSISLSAYHIIALSSSGRVYSVPVSRETQLSGPKPNDGSWFWSSTSPISYRDITPISHKIVSISSGLQHVLLLSSSGSLFSAATSALAYPSKGQLGIPGLTLMPKPDTVYDQPHEISTLRGFNIKSIATGDYHSLALDTEGRVFAFGDNSTGQLGIQVDPDIRYIDAPSLVPISRLYTGSYRIPTVRSISAGGANSFFSVDATKVALPDQPLNVPNRVSSDTWSCGQGINGQLGTGRWTHIEDTPKQVQALSGLFEYDEDTESVIPIRVKRLIVGATHSAAVLANLTNVSVDIGSNKDGENDVNYGYDVLWWGSNEYFQLGTGKRNSAAKPIYIGPLDGSVGVGEKREEHRFHLTPKKRMKVNGKWVRLDQRIECGRYVTAVYSGVASK